MFKKIIAAMMAVGGLTFAMGGIPDSYALVPAEAVELGGLRPGYTLEYMKSIYGEPTLEDYKPCNLPAFSKYEYKYGDSVSIISVGGKIIVDIHTSADNGWTTPAGVAVGMDKSVLQDVYGKEDDTFQDKGILYYQYFVHPSRMSGLSFGIKNDKIVSITAYMDQ
ncbi:hypothetical protein [Megasphaera sp.]|uniref:hypothetical protein n=1 Tax=Megasphaera sp. TaxID=2023260 RepID=UPI00257C3473|nr:hypothetical protein [Megasphaera sp.]